MSEVGCDFALWGDPGRPLPHNGDEEAEDLENVLPISSDLRFRILDWARHYCRFDGGEGDLDWDFDGRGMHLSRELQQELGSAYRVHYMFTRAGERDRWMALVKDTPCPGWSAS